MEPTKSLFSNCILQLQEAQLDLEEEASACDTQSIQSSFWGAEDSAETPRTDFEPEDDDFWGNNWEPEYDDEPIEEEVYDLWEDKRDASLDELWKTLDGPEALDDAETLDDAPAMLLCYPQAIYTIKSPNSAEIWASSTQPELRSIDAGWPKTFNQHEYIQIRDLGFGACTPLIFEEAHQLLVTGGFVHHIKLCFKIEDNAYFDRLGQTPQELFRQPFPDSLIRQAGFQFYFTDSMPLDLEELDFESLLDRELEQKLYERNLVLAAIIRHAYKNKQFSITANFNAWRRED